MARDLDRAAPNKEFLARHDVTLRKSVGFRLLTRLEQMTRGGMVTPAHFWVGRRFATCYAVGVIGPSGSAMFRESISGGSKANGGHPSEDRLDAYREFEDARIAVDDPRRGRHKDDNGIAPSRILLWLCYDDVSFPKIGEQLGLDYRQAQMRCAVHLEALLAHYLERERKTKIRIIPHTEALAFKDLDPDEE